MSNKTQVFHNIKEIADFAPYGIGVFDLQKNELIFFNEAYYQMVGYTEEEYAKIANGIDFILTPEDQMIVRHEVNEFKQSEKAVSHEFRIVCKDGSVLWVKMDMAHITVESLPYAFISVTNTTDEKVLSTQLEMIAENVDTSLSLFKFSKNGEELVYGNKQFYKNTGLSPENYYPNMPLINKACVSEEDYELITQGTYKAIQTGEKGEITHRFFLPDGKVLWLSRKYAAIKQDADDTYLVISAVTNVTKEKERELEIAIEKQRFQKVVEELDAAIFEWNLQTGTFYSSEAYEQYALSSIDPMEILNNRGPLDVVHPEDIPVLMQFFTDSKSGKERIETVLRIRLVDGTYRWCRMLGFYYKDDNGTPLRTVGVIIDINAEHENGVMLNSLLNEIPGGVAILYYSDELHFQYFTEGFANLGGWTKEEVEDLIRKGEFLNRIIASIDQERVMETIKSCIATGQPIDITYRYNDKTNNVLWIHLTATKIREENGYPVYYCVFSHPSDEAMRYSSIVEDSPVGVVVAEKQNRNIIYINDVARQLCGFTEYDKVMGLSLIDTLKKEGKAPILSSNEIQSLSYDRYTESHVERNGKYLSCKAMAVEWNGVDSYIIYIADETSEHEKTLLLQRLIDDVPAGIGIFDVIDENVTLVYLNNSYFREMRIDRKEQKHYSNVLKGVFVDDLGEIKRMISTLYKGENQTDAVVRLIRSSGDLIWHKLSVSVVERKDRRLRVYICFSNCDAMIKTQQKLESNRVKEQTMLASIPGGAAIYRIKKEHRVVMEYASEGYAHLMGYRDAAEMQADLHEEADIKIPQEERRNLMKHVLYALEHHTQISFVYNMYTKSQKIVKIRMDANVMPKSQLHKDELALLYVVHTPVSKETELALKEQKRYRTLMAALDVAIVEWEYGKELFTSEKYTKYALSREGLEFFLKDDVSESVVHPEDISIMKKFVDECRKKPKKASVILRMKMIDGSYRWTEMYGLVDYDEDNSPKRIIGVLRDVDKERIEQTKRLQRALIEAEKANQAKSDFLSRVSHDMRTPLNGMLGLANLIKDSVTDQKVQQDISQMELSGQYLLNLINDTLDVSRIESGKLELHPSVCEGHAFFESIIALSKPLIEGKQIKASYHIEGVSFPMLYIDIGRVQQIMMNILGNAVKFTHEGGHISATIRNISYQDGLITDEICVEDDGIGMSEEFLPHIFEMFSQADTSKKNSRQGTGLGMIISKELVEMMGGTISVESKLDEGTKVTFSLVMPVATDEQIREWKEVRMISKRNAELSGKRILLCEDHPVNAMIACRLLEKKGILVEHAENGEIGLDKFAKSSDNYYDAILMDIRMPKMDGLETTLAIRELERKDAQTIPIVAMTANAFHEDIMATRRAGMDRHLSKPIDDKMLFDTLAEVMITGHVSRKQVILIVDDSEINREILKKNLDGEYEILEAADGVNALEILDSRNDIDAVITDIQMPNMDGIEFVKRIRQCSQWNAIRILANTQYGDSIQEKDLIKAGADDFVYKPLSPDIVNLRLHNVLQRKQFSL